MRLNAYVLAADPTWIQASVRSYYDLVDTLVVCFDRHGRGWTGAEIPVQECVARVKEIDHAGKIRYLEGDFARPDHSPMENDTYQRQQALDAASEGADWVLSIDSDELIPQPEFFRDLLRDVPASYQGVLWPMRILFQTLPDGRYLEVCTRRLRRQVSEYPGPIAVRPGVKLTQARRAEIPFFHCEVRRSPLDWLRPKRAGQAAIPAAAAIWHFTWVRGEAELRTKLSSWSHSQDFQTEEYLQNVWRAAPTRWKEIQDFHPIYRGLWPALRPAEAPTFLRNLVRASQSP